MNSFYDDRVINTKLLVNYFKEMCKTFVPPYKSEYLDINHKSLEINGKITKFLIQLKRLINEGKCDTETFKCEILKIENTEQIHLELFWYLEVYNLITLNEIIQHHEKNSNNGVVEHIAQSLFKNMLHFKPKQSFLRQKLLSFYLKIIFSHEKNYTHCNDLSLSKITLDLLISNLIEFFKMKSSDASFFSDTLLDAQNLIELFTEAKLDFPAINNVFVHIITSLLEGSCQMLTNVLLQQSPKTNFKEQSIYNFLKLASKYFEINCLLEGFQNILLDQSKTVNWGNALPFIVYVGDHYPDGWKKLRRICDSVLKFSFCALDKKLLFYGFIIARQGCFVKAKGAFPSYMQWFGSKFSSKSSTPINSKETCHFFFSFLIDLIPYDCVQYLKVHINRLPLVPTECEALVHQYTNDVKSRLHDLNVSAEIGICENNTEKNAAAFDVENVIKHFMDTNTILNSVFQSAMFNKTYFEKKFLIELLSKYDGKNSPRHKIILKLKALGKIPKSLYKKYENLEKRKH